MRYLTRRKWRPLTKGRGYRLRAGSRALLTRHAARLVRLPAQESRDIELIFLGLVMHSLCTAVRVEALRHGPAGVFGHRVRLAAFRMTRARTGGPFELRDRLGDTRSRRRLHAVFAAAKADLSQPLHQRHATFLGVIVVELAALRLDLVLRR